jgi:hypothetical protein
MMMGPYPSPTIMGARCLALLALPWVVPSKRIGACASCRHPPFHPLHASTSSQNVRRLTPQRHERKATFPSSFSELVVSNI